jgi:hypothetical protein
MSIRKPFAMPALRLVTVDIAKVSNQQKRDLLILTLKFPKTCPTYRETGNKLPLFITG